MASIMQMFRAKNKVSRNAFDLSQRVVFSAKVGELLPTYSALMMIGDKAQLSNKWKTRTLPINTAAFTRFKEYYDWYFVPLHLLWDKYNVWSQNLTEQNQVATSINGKTNLTDRHPYFNRVDVRQVIFEMYNPTSSTVPKSLLNQFGFERYKLTQKLLSYLGYGSYHINIGTDYDEIPIYQPDMSAWRLLAYQKIYQDYYRNSQWESSAPETFNVNYLDGSSVGLEIPVSDIDLSKDSMFDLRYANWKKDIFTGLLPNSQFGDTASINMGELLVSRFDGTGIIQNETLNIRNDVNGVSQVKAGTGDSSPLRLNSSFTILALRQAEALQKYKEITQSNPQDFPSQAEAHFGKKPSQAYSQRCRWLKGYDNNIVINEVTNTNLTGDNSSNQAGRAEALGQGQEYTFEADVPGILMCIYHVVPLLDYALTGIDPDNLKTYFGDYAMPEFDKTGMQQVPLIWLTNSWDPNVAGQTYDGGSGLLGYAPAYIEYKTKWDVVRGAFVDGGLDAWVSPITRDYLNQYLLGLTSDDTSSTIRFNGIDYRFFKVNPSITDSIFSGEVANADSSSDKFMINCYHDVNMIRPLDRDGLPY